MARTKQPANKSRAILRPKNTSPKPKVVSTSNGKKKVKSNNDVKRSAIRQQLQRNVLEHKKKMLAAHATYQEKHEKGKTLEQRAFDWFFSLWEDHDGPAGIDGVELDWDPESHVAVCQNDESHAECCTFATREEMKRAVEYCVENDVLYYQNDPNSEYFHWEQCEFADNDAMKNFMFKHMTDSELRKFCEECDEGIVEDIMYEKGWEDEEDDEDDEEDDEDDEEKHMSLDEFENVVYSYLEAMVKANKVAGAKSVFFQFPKKDYEEEYAEAVRRFEAGEYKKKKDVQSPKKVEDDDEDYSMSDDSDEESSSDDDESDSDEED